ncbi:alpha-amylase family glycosyl hydrolase [Serratia quinivorans]|uniref:alpha-amylase family glycosyl hydrolase n=1 Tax=Serratia quinivorans TaxID=137545 RepID=UPI002177005B|nr:alpha-amylase family glycosyl hydrolase [Serratia quinivorans]CAI1095236.1 Oligo-1,6-glucosidase [Serratia quinivorans]
MSPMPTATQPTLYRIHPVSFRDGNGDGVGDTHGMIAALPYLSTLSIDGLVLPQDLAAQEAAAVAAQGLALWYCDGPNHIRRAAAAQQYLRSPLALEVVPFSVERLVEVLNARRTTLAESLWSTGDTDQPRVVSHWGQGNLRSADAFLTLLAMLPAPICLYQGEELGLPHAAGLQDPLGAQTPMPWHEAPEQVTAGEIHWYQQVAIEHRALAISRQQHDHQSTLRYCQSLLALRRLAVIQQGELSAVSQSNGVVRLLITHQDQCLEALINLQPYTQAAAPSEATLPLAWQHGAQQEGHQWVLAGFASAIFTRNVNCESRGVTHG